MAERHSIDAATVRALFSYDPETGQFFSRKTGKNVGWLSERGYIKVRVNRVWKRAHRLAWLYVHGDTLPEQVDHINGDRADNRIANLRASDAFLNQQNRTRAERGSITGLLGVKPTRSGKFAAGLRVRGEYMHLGVFDDPQSAHQAYLTAKAEHHPHAWVCRTNSALTSVESTYEGRATRQESRLLTPG